MWKNKLENKKFKKGKGGLLDEAISVYSALMKKFDNIPKIVGAFWLRDSYGTIGLNSNDFLVVAKKYTYGDIVSVHKLILDTAISEGKKILMYIKKNSYFYLFSLVKINKVIPNKRGSIEMINFSIRRGINVIKFAEFKSKTNDMVVKNEEYSNKIQKKLI